MTSRAPLLLTLACVLAAAPAAGQGIIVDQGEFEVRIAGRRAGTETFVIRRSGGGRGDAVFASGIVTLDRAGGRQEIRPLLSTIPPEGTAEGYQVRVTGPDALELRLNVSGRRYIARITSDIGAEDREFPARPDTHVIEADVAHQYYFLRDFREGHTVPVLEPRTRRQLTLVAGPRADVELQVGRNVVQARRIELADGEDRRIVWFDRQGRVLRVEVPAAGYIAERTDILG